MYQRRGGYYGGGGGGGFGLGFSMTPVVRNLMIANAIVFVLQLLGRIGIFDFGVSVGGVLDGRLWQPFTYMWLHGSYMHIIFNMFALWMFGPQLEYVWGPQRFLRFYLICGVGAGIVIVLCNSVLQDDPYLPTVGASGALYGVLTAFSLLWPDRTIMLLFPPIPLRAIYFIPFLFVMGLVFGDGKTSHVGHLGGVITAAILLRGELKRLLDRRNLSGLGNLRYRWNRYRMRGRLRAIQREEWERRRRSRDDGPTLH